jgi:hypothetical protein
MKFTANALFAVVAVAASTFDVVSPVTAFAPTTSVTTKMITPSNAYVYEIAPSSSTELNMGLRSFFSRNKKGITKSNASADISKDEVRALFR